MNLFDFTFKDLAGNDVPFSRFKNKVCLVVNMASKCRFTSQLHDLQTLYLFYKARGFEVLAFPSDDFGNQEPFDNTALKEFCGKNYMITFQVFEKSHVVGKEMNSVYSFLCSKKQNRKLNSRPLWNFHKYLVDRNGNVSDFFYSFTNPTSNRIMKRIEELLNHSTT